MARADQRYLRAQQFENPANPAIHRVTTTEEVWRDTDSKVDIVVAGAFQWHHHRRRASHQGTSARFVAVEQSASSTHRVARRDRHPIRASGSPVLTRTPGRQVITVGNRGRAPTWRAGWPGKGACWSASPRAPPQWPLFSGPPAEERRESWCSQASDI